MSLAATALVTVLGAGCAAGTLWLARRAENASRPGGEAENVSRPGGEAELDAAGAGAVGLPAREAGAGDPPGEVAAGSDSPNGGERWWEAQPWWESLSEDERGWVVRNLAEAGHAPGADVD
ncbi:hypothetical protein [Cryptosporangium japonicum]|uniref:Uncharacterized protein n=1 Tax=Cryptosporangium japonicum TaxID=80872 RepID=A0ABP3EVH0_9ACTN